MSNCRLVIPKGMKLSPSPSNCLKDFRKILPLLISINWPSLVGFNVWWFKRYIQKCTVSRTNTHHDVTDLVNLGMIKNIKAWISREQNITFLWNKKYLICASDGPLWEVILQRYLNFAILEPSTQIQVWRKFNLTEISNSFTKYKILRPYKHINIIKTL